MKSNEDILKAIRTQLEDLKATNIEVINVEEKTSSFSFIVIATCRSNAHGNAIVDKLRTTVKSLNVIPTNPQGDSQSEWLLIDLGSIIVHVMTEASRAHYNLEKLWGGI